MAEKSTTGKERFSTFGRTTLKKINKMRIYIEGLSKVPPCLSCRSEST